MAGVAENETKTASPEKIQNGDSVEKAEITVKNSHPVEKEVEEVEEKVAENGKTASPKKNGNSTAEEVQQNGQHEEEKAEESEEKESTEEVDAVKEPVSDACCLKRKSTGGDVTAEETATEVTSPKKAKLDEIVPETESNGCQHKA